MSKKAQKPEETEEVKAPVETKEPEKVEAAVDQLIMKLSEIQNLSEAEQQAFRQAGGTAVEG